MRRPLLTESTRRQTDETQPASGAQLPDEEEALVEALEDDERVGASKRSG